MKNERPNLIIDLDETLIHSVPTDEIQDEQYLNCIGKVPIHNMEDYYLVFERPNLQQFLDHIFKNYNVSVWTAASKDYALFIIERCLLTKPNRKIDYIFFSHHCDLARQMKKKSQKDLRMLREEFGLGEKFDISNVVLLDDLRENLKGQEDNSVLIKSWEGDNVHDNSLIDAQKKIKKIVERERATI